MLKGRKHLTLNCPTFFLFFFVELMIYCSQKCWRWIKCSPGVCREECEKTFERTKHQESIWILMCRHLEPVLMSSSCGETVLGLYGFGIPGIIRSKICHLRVQGGCGRHAKTYPAHDLTESMGQSSFPHISLAIKVSLYCMPNKTCQPLLKETSVHFVKEEQLNGPLTNKHSFYITKKKWHQMLEYLGKQNKQNCLNYLLD